MCNDFHCDDATSRRESASLRSPRSDLKPFTSAMTLDARSARFVPQPGGRSQVGAPAARDAVIPVATTSTASTRRARPHRYVRDRVCMTGQLRSREAVTGIGAPQPSPQHASSTAWYPRPRTTRRDPLDSRHGGTALARRARRGADPSARAAAPAHGDDDDRPDHPRCGGGRAEPPPRPRAGCKRACRAAAVRYRRRGAGRLAGESVVIPSEVPHAVEALEDSVVLDVFSPVRDDWVRGDDAYLRG
jgi:hypothetical protein